MNQWLLLPTTNMIIIKLQIKKNSVFLSETHIDFSLKTRVIREYNKQNS